MKIYHNFERLLTPYIISFSKIKIKHLFYKLESIFRIFCEFFEPLEIDNTVAGLKISYG